MVRASLMRHSDRSLNLTDPLNQIERIVSCRFVGNPGGRWNLFATSSVFRRKGFIEESDRSRQVGLSEAIRPGILNWRQRGNALIEHTSISDMAILHSLREP